MIDGVEIRQLRIIPDERGMILSMLRNDEEHFKKFGEIYFSEIYPGVVKGWHIHERMTLNYAVVTGSIKLVLYDGREASSTKGEVQEIFLGRETAIVANCSDIPHDPQEISRVDPHNNDIPYNWTRKDG
jgi:dTDP-4-dehydrorhamnose 3,5-epimerase